MAGIGWARSGEWSAGLVGVVGCFLGRWAEQKRVFNEVFLKRDQFTSSFYCYWVSFLRWREKREGKRNLKTKRALDGDLVCRTWSGDNGYSMKISVKESGDFSKR